MLKIFQKTTNFFILWLFFLLPLINSHLLNLFWINLNVFVNWNYEFTKVMFFNTFSFLIITSYLMEVMINKKIKVNFLVFLVYFFLVLIISTVFSLSPLISLLWNDSKAHWLIMFSNLIWLFIVIQNRKKGFLKKVLLTSVYSAIIVSIIWVWQYYIPSFDYWNLKNRAISTLGYPNYLALYILMIIPLILKKNLNIPSMFKKIILLTLIFALILTKSLLWILLLTMYFIYKLKSNLKRKVIILTTIAIVVIVLINFPNLNGLFNAKIHSFISRFFIWETAFKLITSNLKTFIIWNWAETLKLVFDSYKSNYLYIFENIWFTADRPHNLILNFFYHFWLIWALVILTIIYYGIKKSIKKHNAYSEIIIIFFLFTIFNFPSIIHYLLFIAIIAIISKKSKKYKSQRTMWVFIFFTIIFIISFFWAINSIKFYIAENHLYKDNLEKAISIFPYNPNYYYNLLDYDKLLKIEKFKSEKYYKSKIYWTDKIIKNCKALTKKFPSVENFFFCWDILEKFNYKKKSKEFYKLWLKIMPNLWDKKSKYWDNFLVKKTINWNRFFSKKYSDIKSILEKTNN